MRNVAELMTKEVITVPPTMTVREVANLLFKLKISGLPVVDEEEHVIGMITEKDIINMALPKYIEQVGDFAYLLDTEPFKQKVAEAHTVLVQDIMRKEVTTVTEDTPVPECARIMITKKIRRLPVVHDKKLVGIIARADIVKEIARQTGII